MTVYRMPVSIWGHVEAELNRGRSKAHTENIVGLPAGTLSRPYIVDHEAERAAEARRQEVKADLAAWNERERRRWRAFDLPKSLEGWRPANDCISDRPNAGKHFKPRSRT